MRKHTLYLILSAILLTAPLCGLAATHSVGSAAEAAAVCRSLQPGDTVVLADGVYTDQYFVFSGKGTEEQPITLRSETPGNVILNGSSRLSIGGEYLVVDGLLFLDGALESGSIVEFRAGDSSEARHCTLRNTAIINYNPENINTRYFWVTLHGFGNRVEDCTFSGQKHSGVTVCVRLSDNKPAGHIIRRNHFVNRPVGNGNGFESIRIGTGAHLMTDARCVVTGNLFEQCNGEIEIISNKSCENVYTHNTFLRSAGCLTIRQGNRCRVENNVFIGGDEKDTGGVRVTGADHRIAGNFFSGIRGRAGGVIALQAGTSGSPRGGYAQVTNCEITGNTFVENPGTLFELDAGFNAQSRTRLPAGVTISDNLMVVPADAQPMIGADNPPTGIVWQKNMITGGDPQAELPPGIESVSAVPAQLKPRTEPRPLTADDVGPAWMHESGAERSAQQ